MVLAIPVLSIRVVDIFDGQVELVLPIANVFLTPVGEDA